MGAPSAARCAATVRAAAIAALVALAPRDAAAADDAVAPDAPAPLALRDTAFRYPRGARAHPLRATLEVSALLGAGLAEYFALQESNSGDWDLGYDWPSFRKKLVGEAVSFDTNRFDTNFITHPAAGALYYLAARGNRLGVLESFAFAAFASTLWEYVGELREQVSVNDLLVTPIAGMVVGEATTQLGALFDRGCATLPNRVLGAVFAPATALHDVLDGVAPARLEACDAYALPTRGYHALSLFAGAGLTATAGASSPYQELRAALLARVVNIAAYDRAGYGFRAFDDGNVADLRADVTLSRLAASDVVVAAHIAPVGAYGRAIARRDDGGLEGQALLLGLELGMAYTQHDYDRDRDGRLDRVFVLDVLGGAGEWSLLEGTTRLRLRVRGAVGYAAIDPFALGSYAASHGVRGLPSATRDAGYYHALVADVAPSLRLDTPALSLGVEVAYETFARLRGLDRYGGDGALDVDLHDDRTVLSSWLSHAPFDAPVRVTTRVDTRTRRGRTGTVLASAREVSAVAGLELTF